MKLRTRVLLGFAMIFVVVIAAGVFTVNAQRKQLYDQIDDRLRSTPLPQEARARPPGAGPRADGAAPADGAAASDAPGRGVAQPVDDESISDLYVAVLTPDDTVRPVIEGQLLVDRPDVQSFVDDRPTDDTIITVDGVDGVSAFRALFLTGTDASLEAVVAVPVDDVDDTIRQLTFTFVGVAGLILLTLIVIASWLNRFGLRPIGAMTDVAEAISSGERDRRATVKNDATEAGRLGHAFNLMLDERDAGEERLRQFVSNASHELRTPLTSIRGYLDLYAAGGFRQPGELDDAIRRLQVEAERMNLLVEDLLVLAKFDEEQPLDISTVRVDEMVRDVAALALAGHPDRHIDVDTPDEIDVDVDRLRLHQALAVLVDNAIRHTPDDAAIQVAATRTRAHVELVVTDTGPGLTAEEAAKVFNRFSRGDRSRARSTGGSGLGLSIAQAIVHAHGGEISV
ncbi:MAG: ATP-binding protein, partial [Actinomycetota bacterium]